MAGEDTPRGRLAAAAKDKPKMAYVRVLAGDVVEVGKSAARHTATTAALVKGAEGAIAERIAADPGAELEVFQVAGQVQELLEVSGGATNAVPKGQ